MNFQNSILNSIPSGFGNPSNGNQPQFFKIVPIFETAQLVVIIFQIGRGDFSTSKKTILLLHSSLLQIY